MRAPDPADRRRNVISVTDAGADEARRLGDDPRPRPSDLLAPLSATEREQLTRLLTRLLRHHSRH